MCVCEYEREARTGRWSERMLIHMFTTCVARGCPHSPAAVCQRSLSGAENAILVCTKLGNAFQA